MDILKKAGFTGNGLKMAYAIAMAESGGNANAHNGNAGTGDNSYGLFQINMLGSMGPERLKQYGLSNNNALFDPLTNAKVAFKMSHGGAAWGPWSTYTNGAYKQYYGGSSASVSGGGGAGGTAVTPKLSDDELASQYGLTSALINSSSELKKLFKQAVAGNWTADLFTAKLKNTKWWSTQPDTLRQYLTTKYTDPATWKQKNQQAAYDLNQLAVSVGLGNQIWLAGKGKGMPNALLQQAIYNSVALGWSDDRIKSWFAARATTHGGAMWGDAGQAFDQLHALAYENGMQYTGWYTTTARAIAGGQTTLEAAESTVRQQAAAKYTAFADQIKAGQNVMDLAAPYIQSVAKILEVPDTDVDLFNSHVSKAMMTNVKGQSQTIWDFENSLRQDPAWKKTQNAQDSATNTAHQVLTQFGMVF